MAKTSSSAGSDISTKKSPTSKKTGLPKITPLAIASVEERLAQYQYLIDNGALPPHIDNPAKALAVEMQGKELGLGFMTSCMNLFPVGSKNQPGYKIGLNGIIDQWCMQKAGVYAQTVRDFEKAEEISNGVFNYVTEILFWRFAGPEKTRIEERGMFSRRDAMRIETYPNGPKLAQKDNYKNYERWMMWWRAYSQGSDRIAGWAKLGLPSVVELGGVLDMQGNVVQAPIDEGKMQALQAPTAEVIIHNIKPQPEKILVEHDTFESKTKGEGEE